LKDKQYVTIIILENIIELYFDFNYIEEARIYIDEIYNKFGEKNKYYYYLARYNYCKKEISSAIEYLNKFIQIDHKFAPAYSLLNFLYVEYTMEYSKAIELNKKGLSEIHDDYGVINNLAYSYLMNNDLLSAKNILI
jgi:tetratricopeptide (TPR) repeat protein